MLKKLFTLMKSGGLDLLPPKEPLALHLLDEKKLDSVLPTLELQDIREAYANDPWLMNYFMNRWEFLQGRLVLESYPFDVAIPMHGRCNADCNFCITTPQREKYADRHLLTSEVAQFAEVLKYARMVGLPGPGEPLLNPAFEKVVEGIADLTDPRCTIYMITNGLLLKKHIDFFKRGLIKTFDVSVNAASALTHAKIMKLQPNAFEVVLEGIRQLVRIRDNQEAKIEICMSMVLTKDNLHELEGFIDRKSTRLNSSH